MLSSSIRSTTTAALALAVCVAVAAVAPTAQADQYFRGDGTTYTLGDTSAGNCNMMAVNSDAGDNYAALNDVQWNGLKNCGRCAQVSCDDDRCADKSTTQIVQILDRCPECKNGDLDLSPSVFTKLTGSSPSRYKIKWMFVDCPIQGNIKYCLKSGSNNFWTAIQPTNVVSGVANMKVNGQSMTMVDSAYYYLLNGNSQVQTDLTRLKVTLTSVNGESIEDTVSLKSGSCTTGSVQFGRGQGSSGNSNQQEEQRQATEAPATTAPTPPPTTAAPTPPPTTAAPTPPPTTVVLTPPPTTAAPTPEPTPAPTPEPTPAPTPEPTPSPAPTPTVSAAVSSGPGDDERSISPTSEPFVTPSTSPTPTITPTPTPTPNSPAPTTLIPTPAPNSPVPTTLIPTTLIPTPVPSPKTNNSTGIIHQEDRSGLDTVAVPTSAPTPTTVKLSDQQNSNSNSDLNDLKSASTPAPSSTTKPEDTVQNANTKSDDKSSSTDPLILLLSGCGAAGVVVLLVLAAMVRRKRIQEKARDDEPVLLSAVVTRSYDRLSTPASRTDIAML